MVRTQGPKFEFSQLLRVAKSAQNFGSTMQGEGLTADRVYKKQVFTKNRDF